MLKPKAIPAFQVTASLGTVGIGLLVFPRFMVEYTNTAAPLVTFAAILLMISGGMIVAFLGMRYPEHTIFAYSDHLIGKWLSGILVILISLYFFVLAGLYAREFGEVVVTSVLQNTPVPVTVFAMLMLAVLSSRQDIAVFSRILTFYMPFVYLPALIIVVTSLKNADMNNVKPLLSGLKEVQLSQFVPALLIAGSLFQNFFILGLQIPFMYRPSHALKSTVIGMGGVGVLYLIVMYATLSVFGVEEIKQLLWPTLELAKTAALPSFYVERMDPIFLAVWVTSVFCAIFAAYYIGIQALSHVLRFRDHRVLSLPLLPVVLFIAKSPANVYSMYRIDAFVGMVGLSLTLGFPTLLLVFHVLKNRRKAIHLNQEELA